MSGLNLPKLLLAASLTLFLTSACADRSCDKRDTAQVRTDQASVFNRQADALALRYANQWRNDDWSNTNFEKAESLYKQALALREKNSVGPDDLLVAETLNNLGALYYSHNFDADRAEPLLRRALAIRLKKLGPEDLDLATTLGNLSAAEFLKAHLTEKQSEMEKQFLRAEEHCKRALAIKEKVLGVSNSQLAKILNDLGQGYEYQLKFTEAEALYRRAMALEVRTTSFDNNQLESERNLERLCSARDSAQLTRSFVVGDYTYVPMISGDSPTNPKGLQLLKGGKVVFQNDLGGDYHHSPGNIIEMVDNSAGYASKSLVFPLAHARIRKGFNPNGGSNIDLTGDVYTRLAPVNNLYTGSLPGVIVGTFSGGANSCCTDYELFALGAKAKKLPSLEGRNVYKFTFGDFHGDGHQQALGSDMTFVYWLASRPDCPTPTVVLNYGASGWHLALEDMRIDSNSISQQDINQAVDRCKDAQADGEKENTPTEGTFHLDPCVWETMLNLIYAGHSDLAYKFLDQYWPVDKLSDQTDDKGNYMDKAEFVRAFKATLQQSPYYKDLTKLNAGQKI